MRIAERVARIKQEKYEQAERQAQKERKEQMEKQRAEENARKISEEKAKAFANKVGLEKMIRELRYSFIDGPFRWGINKRSRLTENGTFFCLEWGDSRGDYDKYINISVNDESVFINGVGAGNKDSIEEALARAFVNPRSHQFDKESVPYHDYNV